MDEPKRPLAVVRDRDGNLWQRGLRLWASYSLNEGRWPWSALWDQCGPLTVDMETERLEDAARVKRGWKPIGETS